MIRRRRPGGDAGHATAELAVAFPAVLLLLAAVVGGVYAAVAQVRCVDAAREAALAEARGEAGALVGASRAPEGARVRIDTTADTVTAVVTVEVRPWAEWLPGVPLRADATAAREDVGVR
ncbi:TadE-like protein [Stackebrandtia albiflava]|uniref:TadE-like protein n=1 Tax=Stackebrandtia albiflava TaxID=406432 RepID=A0A562UYQ6_9ACTN|nr:TadE family type IV pilus minor pilin [Stackebrandtia albiflava]TWJ10771.1 TadE-like protein [Stackebrandtia albiflava]